MCFVTVKRGCGSVLKQCKTTQGAIQKQYLTGDLYLQAELLCGHYRQVIFVYGGDL